MRLVFSLLFLLLAPIAAAQEISTGTESPARAGVAVALPQNESAAFVNPAGASLTPFLLMGGTYENLSGDGYLFSTFAVDGTAPLFDGALSLSSFFSENVNIVETRISTSLPIGPRMAVGVTESVLFRSDLPEDDNTFASTDLGIVMGAGKGLSLGVVLQNAAASRLPDRRRLLRPGAAFPLGSFLLAAEGSFDLTEGAAGEYALAGSIDWKGKGPFTFRSGYRYDRIVGEGVEKELGMGVSYRDERSTLDISWLHSFTDEVPSRLSIGIRFFLPGMGGQATNPNGRPVARPTRR